jgi:hypothetical protein
MWPFRKKSPQTPADTSHTTAVELASELLIRVEAMERRVADQHADLVSLRNKYAAGASRERKNHANHENDGNQLSIEEINSQILGGTYRAVSR